MRAWDFPRKIQVQTFDGCNYRCVMCPYPETAASERRHLSIDLFKRMLAELEREKAGVQLCLMLQNEPLLDKRFLEFLELAHAATDGVKDVATVTNGSALSERLLEDLMEFPRFGMTVSLNANDGERYRRVHGVDMWDRVSSLLSRWRGAKDRIQVSFVVDQDSVDDARRFQTTWERRGYGTRLVPVMSRAGAVGVDDDARLTFDPGFGHCHYPADTLTVLADGRAILCCQDWQHEYTFGDLSKESIRDVWHKPELVRIRNAAIDGTIRDACSMCTECDYPMRSSVRHALEERLHGRESTPLSSFREHPAAVRVTDGKNVCPVLVCDVNAAEYSVDVVVLEAQGMQALLEVGQPMSFRIQPCAGEQFAFGSLAPHWCPVRDYMVHQSDGSSLALRLLLDPEAPEAALLPWYEADWRCEVSEASRNVAESA